MNISLTPELGRYVNQRVKSGQYTSASEVVREGLRLMQHREAARKQLKRAIQKGLDEARRGQLVDGEEFFRDLLQTTRARRRKAG